MYAFGENELYNISQSFSGVRQWLQRNFAIGITLFWGRGLLWMSPLETAVLSMEIGSPVPLPQKFKNNSDAHHRTEPTDSDIQEYHAAFLEAQIQLFDRTKA